MYAKIFTRENTTNLWNFYWLVQLALFSFGLRRDVVKTQLDIL